MARYRISFLVKMEREIEVPDGEWHECYKFAQEQLGFDELVRSPACRIVEVIRSELMAFPN